MGTDIHMHVERKEPDGWRVIESEYLDRNYALFAILADVRNGYGFAGVETHKPIKPVRSPRGIPDDVSSEVRGQFYEWGIDAYSCSYLTARELLAVDWHGERIEYPDESETWADAVGGQFMRFLAQMERDANGDLDAVRTVFWFNT